MPTLPCGEGHGQEAIYYWEGAYYLMVYLLGRSDPAQGLKWFYAHGKQTKESRVLDLLRSVYDSNDQLSMLAAWVWEKQSDNAKCIRDWAFGGSDSWTPTEKPLDPGQEWWQAFRHEYNSGK